MDKKGKTIMDKNAKGASGASRYRMTEELTMLQEEMQLKDDEIALVRKRLRLSEESVKRWM